MNYKKFYFSPVAGIVDILPEILLASSGKETESFEVIDEEF